MTDDIDDVVFELLIGWEHETPEQMIEHDNLYESFADTAWEAAEDLAESVFFDEGRSLDAGDTFRYQVWHRRPGETEWKRGFVTAEITFRYEEEK